MTAFIVGDRLRHSIRAFNLDLVRDGQVTQVRPDGSALVQFGPDAYSKVPYEAYVWPGHSQVEHLGRELGPLFGDAP